MDSFKILTAVLGLTAAVAAQAEGIRVAEFRADQGLLPDSSRAVPAGERELYGLGSLYTEEIGGAESRSWSFGPYTFSGIVNWEQRANYRVGEPYSDEQFLSLGSKFTFGEGIETHLYHGQGREIVAPDMELYGLDGSGEMSRTGIAQNLYFADPDARVGLGYEYATGDRELSYQGLEGHEINVSGEIQIGWGFDARLQASYGLYSYSEYEGIQGGLKSARTNMSAGIQRSLSSDLSWGLRYSYIDEDFATSDLSQSTRTWGLNLEYHY